jgi:hypothetical protein
MEALKKEEVLPLRNITQEEGVKFSKKAFARGQVRSFRQFILDHITDPVQPRTYPPNCDPDDKGHWRFHPILVTAVICAGVLFAAFLYFSFFKK